MSGREWRITLPPGMTLLNANDRLHHMARYRIGKQLGDAVRWQVRAAKIPRLERARITCYVMVSDQRRRDASNWADTAKPCIDAIVAEGVLPDDDYRHLEGPYMEILAGCARPGFLIRICELKGVNPPQ